uniref:Uncharacterized protein n=1 Tax=Rhizophora mucronata TaxID=61149 RepID=A0A2P2QVL8_RHIMU
MNFFYNQYSKKEAKMNKIQRTYICWFCQD